MPRPKLQRPRTNEDWERHRSTITELYMDQNQTLGTLMQVMEERHSFKATRKQYRRRLQKWGIYKNIKFNEKEALLEAMPRPELDVSTAEFRLNNRPVKPSVMTRFQRNKMRSRPTILPLEMMPVSSDGPPTGLYDVRECTWIGMEGVSQGELVEEAASWGDPETARVSESVETRDTPDFPVLLYARTTPDKLGLSPVGLQSSVEQLLLASKTFLEPLYAKGPATGHFPSTIEVARAPAGFWEDLQNGICLLKKGSSGPTAWSLVSRACQGMKSSRLLADVDFLKELLTTLSPINACTAACAGLRLQLLSYIAGLLSIRFGSSSHPLVQICTLLQRPEINGTASIHVLRAIVDMMQGYLEISHVWMLSMRRRLGHTLRRARDFPVATILCHTQVQYSDRFYDRDSLHVLRAMGELAHVLTAMGHFGRDRVLAGDALDRARRGLECDPPDERDVHTVEDLVERLEATGDAEGGQADLEEVYTAAVMLWGESGSPTMCIRNELSRLASITW